MRSQAAGRGKIPPRCVPEGAPDGKNTGSRQHIACMYSNTANFGKICVACIRKAPQSAVGEHTARTSCRQGAFSPSEALRSCTAHKSCHPLMDLALAQGLLPEQPHRGIAFKRLGPCAGTTSHAGRGSWTLLNAWPMCRDDPSAPPMPATCRYPPLAVPVAARDKPPMSFGGDHPAHGLQSGQAPRGRRLRHLGVRPITECCAEPDLNSKTVSKWVQNRRRRPQARPASALPKTPIERTSSS